MTEIVINKQISQVVLEKQLAQIEVLKSDAVIEVENSQATIEVQKSISGVEVVVQPSAEIVLETNTNQVEVAANVSVVNIPIPEVTLRLTSGEIISAFRCVYVADDGKFYKLLNTDTTNCHAFAGIITRAVVADELCDIIQEGKILNTSWNFTPNQPVFIGADGNVTQTVPTSGFALRLGFAASSQSIIFNVAELTKL